MDVCREDGDSCYGQPSTVVRCMGCIEILGLRGEKWDSRELQSFPPCHLTNYPCLARSFIPPRVSLGQLQPIKEAHVITRHFRRRVWSAVTRADCLHHLRVFLEQQKKLRSGMAPESQGRTFFAGPNRNADGLANMEPPPSTLAAQLVETISSSTTAKTSRPDETGELKRLFAAIERVKNQPDLLKTAEQRIEHNHMLIYVYARVVLEGLKWDDPFANQAQLKAEALKAINFLKVTIKETPTVLDHRTDGKSFLFRGRETLWLWLFPKVLKMLGHSQCLALTVPIEAFFQNLLAMTQSGALWADMSAFVTYFQGLVHGKPPL